jgi:hypothetical protein
MTNKRQKRLLPIIFLVNFILGLPACGPGWDGYENRYSDPGPVSSAPWEGEQSLIVELEGASVPVQLAGMETHDYLGAPAISLSAIIIQSGLAGDPESYRYDFTATDGYNLFIKRYEDIALLPGWSEMTAGYLYMDPRYEDLTAGWEEHPWGSALSAYQVKWMDGGTLTLLPKVGGKYFRDMP